MALIIALIVRLYRHSQRFQSYIRHFHYQLFNSNNIDHITNGEAWLARKISKFSSPNSLIVDIGCNEGQYLGLFFNTSVAFKGQVIAVDAQSQALNVLNDKFQFLRERLQIHCIAI
jgi:hypothetical protein